MISVMIDLDRWARFSQKERGVIAIGATRTLIEMLEEGAMPEGAGTAEVLEAVARIVSELNMLEGGEGVDATLLHRALKVLREEE
jgi:hypothetical protein